MKRDDSPIFLGQPPQQHAAILRELERWAEQGWSRALDVAFAGFLSRQSPDADPLLILAAALASHQLGRGHPCLDLKAALGDARGALSLPPEEAPSSGDLAPPRPPSELLNGVDLQRWTDALASSALVERVDAALPDHPRSTTPLVLSGSCLYLRRYWQYERSVDAAILQRVTTPSAAAAPQLQATLAHALDVLFPPGKLAPAGPDWQKIACALAARQRFGIVTGGPGTGKTTTVVRLLALMQHLARAGDGGEGSRRLRIRLAAPTGKAAARLNESIAGAVARLPLSGLPDAEALRAAIPTEVHTVHRLLGSRPNSRHFQHDAAHPLALDLLVIDEASMLDLEMMAAVLAALPPAASLILLGDKDQLASVDAGAVLGDLCRRADAGHYDDDTAAWVQATTGQVLDPALCSSDATPLDQAIVKLRMSHRFSAESGIGQLADAVNRGDAGAVQRCFDERHADLARVPAADPRSFHALVVQGKAASHNDGEASAGHRHYLERVHDARPPIDAEAQGFDSWARDVLAAYGEFQILCGVRKGPQGVEAVNRRVEAMLRSEGLIEAESGDWYPGRPVMVTRNDYGLGLMNGDVGVALLQPAPAPVHAAEPEASDRGHRAWILRVAFPSGDGQGGIRWILPSRLRAVETVFAMTVHKSQGSEFGHAVLLLPERMSRVLTRELVYTGITRARRRLTLVGSDEVLSQAIARRVDRMGGWGDDGPSAMPAPPTPPPPPPSPPPSPSPSPRPPLQLSLI
ncbi:exonuclease V (RecBCD complex), alpha chain [Burkholderiales bacterium 8X]|nr:exonuclease V (RecBCD complex), alpha chain [Burkholderiales bacterium 8X]